MMSGFAMMSHGAVAGRDWTNSAGQPDGDWPDLTQDPVTYFSWRAMIARRLSETLLRSSCFPIMVVVVVVIIITKLREILNGDRILSEMSSG